MIYIAHYILHLFSFTNTPLAQRLKLCLVFLLTTLSVSALADDIDCNAYQVPELRDICSSNTAPIYVHRHIPDSGLNSEVKRWGSLPGLHILPPKIYTVDEKIKLNSTQLILPHPSSPLPDGKALRTIELEASDLFSIENDQYFTLLETSNQVSAASIEIHGEALNDHIPGFKLAGQKDLPRVLVYVPESIGVTVAGLVLSGSPQLDHLLWNPFLDDFYWDDYIRNTDPGLRFYRNHLTTKGTRSGVLITGGHHPPDIRNNTILISLDPSEQQASSGIRIEQGAAEVKYNDFVYSGRSNGSQKRIGIEVDASKAIACGDNAFYSPESEQYNDQDIGFMIRTDSAWLSIDSNSLSPLIKDWQIAGVQGRPSIRYGNNYKNPVGGAYRFAHANDFFQWTGFLGVPTVSSVYLASSYNSSDALHVCSLQRQSDYEGYSVTSVIEDLTARSGYYQDCPHYVNTFDAVSISLVVVAGIVSNIFCCGLGCFSFGARRCPYSSVR